MGFPHTPQLAYQVLILGLLGLTCLNLLLNLRVVRRLGSARPPASFPRVSVLVPARNEARCVGQCARSLKALDYPNYEAIILDDNSEDATEALVREAGFGTGRFRLIKGSPLPEGWTGKAWACHQLAQAASGEFLLFTDADTLHAPGALREAIALALETRADLLTVWPRQITLTWSEKLVIPLLFLLALGVYPFALFAWIQDRPSIAARLPAGFLRGLGAANGQFILFKRSAYEVTGGHEKVRSHLVEDVALGREITARMGQGLRLVTCDATEFVACRMYERFVDLWEGFTKNLRAVFEASLLSFLLTGMVQLACFLLPFVLIWCPVAHREWILAQIALIYLLRVILTIRFKTSWLGCMLHPVAHLIALLIGLNSWRKSAGNGVSWKGRVYKVRH